MSEDFVLMLVVGNLSLNHFFFRSQLKHEQKHTTGDRAVPYQTFPKQWTYISMILLYM